LLTHQILNSLTLLLKQATNNIRNKMMSLWPTHHHRHQFDTPFFDDNGLDVSRRLWPSLLPTRLSHDMAEMARRMDDGVRVVNDAKKFGVQMDVSQYRPEEIDVKVSNENDANGQPAYLIVSGKHEEQQDEHGHVSRSFTRRYSLPTDVDAHQLACNLSDTGVLTLQAPRMQPALTGGRPIAITHVANAPRLTGKENADDKVEIKLQQKKGVTMNG